MGKAGCILLSVEMGVPTPVLRAANAVLPRIVPAPRRPAARIPVRWTLVHGTPVRIGTGQPLSA